MRRALQRRLLAVTLAAASFAAMAGPAAALDPRWRPFGPGGGTVTGLAVDPSDSRNLYAAAGDTLYESWSVPVQEGLDAARVGLLKFHPDRPDRIFVTLDTQGDRGLASADGGRTWSFLSRRISRPGLYDLAFEVLDPAAPALRLVTDRSRPGELFGLPVRGGIFVLRPES